MVNRISLEESLFKVLYHPRRTMQKEDYSIYLTTLIIPEPLLVGFILLETICRSAFCFPREPDCYILFAIVRAKISLKLCGELLNSYPDFSRVCKKQKANPCSLSACLFLLDKKRQVWVGLAVLQPISLKPQTLILPVYKSQPAKTRWWSRFPEIKADCCKSWSSLPFCIQGKHFGGGRRLFYQTLV